MKEVLRSVKDNYAEVIIAMIADTIVGILLLFIEPMVKLKINISISILIIISLVLLTFIILYFRQITCSKKLREEIHNLKFPASERLLLFKAGDQVMRKRDEKGIVPPVYSVYKIEGNEVYCRNKNDEMLHFVPDELLTAQETKRILDLREDEERRIQRENEERMAWINS